MCVYACVPSNNDDNSQLSKVSKQLHNMTLVHMDNPCGHCGQRRRVHTGGTIIIIVKSHFNYNKWLKNFRVSNDAFLYLCEQLHASVPKSDTIMRQAYQQKDEWVALHYGIRAPVMTTGLLVIFRCVEVNCLCCCQGSLLSYCEVVVAKVY